MCSLARLATGPGAALAPFAALALLLGGCIGPGLEPPGGDDGAGAQVQTGDRAPGASPGSTTGGSGNGPSGADGGPAPVTPLPDATGSSTGGFGDDLDADDDAGAPLSPQGNPLFEGLWAVEQPTHALYEATVYELRADGTLLEHDTVTLGGFPDDFVTGTVAGDSTECRFGSSWRSDAGQPRRLIVAGVCDDDVAREIVLDFPTGDETAGLVPTITVDGEQGWEHPGWPWSFRKCAELQGCVLEL